MKLSWLLLLQPQQLLQIQSRKLLRLEPFQPFIPVHSNNPIDFRYEFPHVPIYEVSYMWYAAIPCLWTIVVGTLVSFMSKPQDPKTLNPDLISPGLYQIFKPYPKIIRDFITDLGIGSKWVSLSILI